MFYFQQKKQHNRFAISNNLKVNAIKKQTDRYIKKSLDPSSIFSTSDDRIVLNKKQKQKYQLLPDIKQKTKSQRSLQHSINTILQKKNIQHSASYKMHTELYPNYLSSSNNLTKDSIDHQLTKSSKQNKLKPYALYQFTQPLYQIQEQHKDNRGLQFVKNIKQIRNKSNVNHLNVYHYKTINVYDKVGSKIQNKGNYGKKINNIMKYIKKYKEKDIEKDDKNIDSHLKQEDKFVQPNKIAQEQLQSFKIIENNVQQLKKKGIVEGNKSIINSKNVNKATRKQIKDKYQQFSPWHTNEFS